jgi:uncharacterized RDD family membrane protein YckC
MNCPHCGAPAPDNARFCQECGGALQVVCPECGQPAAPGTKFCGNCGARLASQPATPAPTKDDAKEAVGAAFPPPPPPPTAGAPPSGAPTSFTPPPPPPTYSAAAPPPPPPAANTAPARQATPPPPPGASIAAWQTPAGFEVAQEAYAFVGLVPRLLVKIVDGVLLGVVGVALSALVMGGSSYQDPTMVSLVSWLYGLISLAYSVLLEARGGTLGRRILGMRIVSAEDGGPPGLKRSIIRNLMHIVDSLPFLYLVGILTIASSDKKQRLGDRAAGTYVVKK